MAGIASSATAVVIGQVAAATLAHPRGRGRDHAAPTTRPWWSPSSSARWTRCSPAASTWASAAPPGSDQLTARALRRTLQSDVDGFPSGRGGADGVVPAGPARAGGARQPRRGARGCRCGSWAPPPTAPSSPRRWAFPTPSPATSRPPRWSAPWRSTARSSGPPPRWRGPHVMLGLNVFGADTDEEAAVLFTSLQQAFVNLRSGRPGKLPRPQPGYAEALDPVARRMLDGALRCSVVGSAATVRAGVAEFVARTGGGRGDGHRPDPRPPPRASARSRSPPRRSPALAATPDRAAA